MFPGPGFNRLGHDERQLRGVESGPEVLRVMRAVPREKFVPTELRKPRYEDLSRFHRLGQTISQPYSVAFMTEQLQPNKAQRCSKSAPARVTRRLCSPDLVRRSTRLRSSAHSRSALKECCVSWATRIARPAGDGYKGWPEHAPFDAIYRNGSPDHVPAPLVEH